MGEKLRVLQVVTKMNRGGLETFIMNIYRNINRSRVQFDFLYHRDGHFDYDDEIVDLGGKIYRVPRCNPLNPCYYRALDDFFANHPYSVVHSHINCMSALPLASAKRHGALVRIAHSHSSHQDYDVKYPIKIVCKRFIRYMATDLFACGADAGKWMFGTDSFHVVHNGIEVNRYKFDANCRARVRSDFGIDDEQIIIGHVGRFAPVKNHSFIIDVFNEFVKLYPHAQLFLIGEGDYRTGAQKKVNSLGLSSQVRFLGLRSDVADLMQAMDIFLMPSLYEGLPLVLVEAQASGLPCLISEAIPADCELGGTPVRRASLSLDPAEWALILCEMLSSGVNRAIGSAQVREAGFDARSVAEWLEHFYSVRFDDVMSEM